MLWILSWWMVVMRAAQPVNMNIQCQHRKNAVASMAFTEGNAAVSHLVHERGIAGRKSRKSRTTQGTSSREAWNSDPRCWTRRRLVHGSARQHAAGPNGRRHPGESKVETKDERPREMREMKDPPKWRRNLSPPFVNGSYVPVAIVAWFVIVGYPILGYEWRRKKLDPTGGLSSETEKVVEEKRC